MSGMSRPSLSSLAPRAAYAASAVVLSVVAVALATGGGDGDDGPDPSVEVTALGGSVREGSGEGRTIFEVSGLVPGGTADGTVQVTNSGSGSGLFWLSGADFADAPGPGGGRLSDRLQLAVLDVSSPRVPTLVYTGGLEQMRSRPLGFVGPGESRTYTVGATFLPGGDPASDGPYEGSATRISLVWHAIPGSPPEATARPPVKPARRKAAEDLRPPRLALDVPPTQTVLGTGRILVRARCSEPCRVGASGRIRGARSVPLAASPRRAARRGRPVTLRLVLPPAARRDVRRALTNGESARIRVTIEGSDRAGNRARLTRRIWLRPSR